VRERAAHLTDYAKRSSRHEYAERAARLRALEPYRDVTTPLVRAHLEREGIAAYGEGTGRISGTLPY
jgi:hypothetical protein